MAYTPVLFIDIGETGAFFTLRETYLHKIYIRGEGDFGNAVVNGVYQGTVQTEERSFHHFNLSQDADEAWVKASAYADKVGLRLSGSVDEIRQQLRDIKRANAEELARRAAEYEQRRAEWAAQREAERAAWRDEHADLIARLEAGGFDCGSFLSQMVDALREYGSLTERQTCAVCNEFHRRDVAARSRHIGAEGQRIKTRLRVTASRHISTDDRVYPPRQRHLVSLETEDGNQLVWWTGYGYHVFDEFVDGAFTVKGHDEYRGLKQTVVQRVKF